MSYCIDKSFELVFTCYGISSDESYTFKGSLDEETSQITWKTNPQFKCRLNRSIQYLGNEGYLNVKEGKFSIYLYQNSVSGDKFYKHPFTKKSSYGFTNYKLTYGTPPNGCKR